MFINFLHLFQESGLSFIDIFYCFSSQYSIYFFSDLNVFFLLLTLGFIFLLFLVPVGVRLGGLFEIVSCFLR